MATSKRSAALLSAQDAAELLGVHQRTIRRWTAAGQLPFKKVGPHKRLLRFRLEDVEALATDPPAATGAGARQIG